MKDPKAIFNTHIRTAKGFCTIDAEDRMIPMDGKVDIRCTSDDHGETLSLTFSNIQIAVKVKDVEKVIKEARESRGDRA